jgi:hypothetical protein
MAGIPSATLEAWAIPMVVPSFFDHTYVVSSCGLRWRSRGRSNGGARLRSRTGSSAIADCLARPNGLAGIRYGRTGVCHQIANRILHPAGITVVGCGGYLVSVFRFGEHGHLPWPELSACYSGATVQTSGSVGSGGGASGNLSGSVSVYNTPQSGTERKHLTEFLALAERALGNRLESPTRQSLQKIQKDFMRRQTRLVHSLDLGIVTPEEYLAQFNVMLRSAMERMRVVLGEERFDIVFGEAGRHPEGLVDRGTFMDAVASERLSAR